jgi:lipoyl(octanoyl) transferase
LVRRRLASVSVAFEHLGLVRYEEAWDRQRHLHAARAGDQIPDTVLLLEHPPVYTAGKRTEAWERPVDGTPVIDVDRGGKITWHGPGQLVGYPIVKLPDSVLVVDYVRRLEEVLIKLCADLGLEATRIHGRSGVWVPADAVSGSIGTDGQGTLNNDDRPVGQSVDRKVAAIGIRVASGVTMHGFALNCDADLSWFDRIVPCGISDAAVTSLTAELGRRVTVADAIPYAEKHLSAIWEEAEPRTPSVPLPGTGIE